VGLAGQHPIQLEVPLHRVVAVVDRDARLEAEPRLRVPRVQHAERAAWVPPQVTRAHAGACAGAPELAVHEADTDPGDVGCAVLPQRHHHRCVVILQEPADALVDLGHGRPVSVQDATGRIILLTMDPTVIRP
jgi:hypothetical protein